MAQLTFRTPLAAPPSEVYAWHARPGALARLVPPWQRVSLIQSAPLEDGRRTVLSVRKCLLSTRWIAEHRRVREGEGFDDVQIKGPFAHWHHSHRFPPDGDGAVLEDTVTYTLPGGGLGAFFGSSIAHRALVRMFRFRHQQTAADITRHLRVARRPPLRVAVTGASGLIGTQLSAFLTSGGHEVWHLTRRRPRAGERAVFWDPDSAEIDAASLEGFDAVVHLAGESIAGGLWTEARKQRILTSRTRGTRLLADTLAALDRPPAVLVSASAVGFYGDRSDEVLAENSPRGRGFLADVCAAWEESTAPAGAAGIRVVHLRTGLVLSSRGGMLARMLPPFRLGLGGPLGDGGQFMSWIDLDDHVGAIHHLLFAHDVSGPVNVAAPNPVTNRRFARTLGQVLRRPAQLRVPERAVRVLLGQMGDELILASAQMIPQRLEASGFEFLHPDLESSLRTQLGRM